MWFQEITAKAFGGLSGATLTFAPGLNIVFGVNEAGKSTWHDALFAGLCGMRRARGSPKKEDRDFTQRRKPWDGDRWGVSVRVALADDRVIELVQDLLRVADSRAVDHHLGADVSAEVLNEGCPDGSRWLGLDRHAFLATACVRQAQLLAVLEDSGLIQDHLQRAAATGGRDETASAAIQHIEVFLREHVGLNRANSTRPLRRAIDRQARAEAALGVAQHEHAQFLGLMTDAAQAEEAARRARRELLAAELELAARELRDKQARLERVREIESQYPEGTVLDAPDDDALAARVATAIEAWERRPAVHALEGPSATELQAEISALPDVPEGDSEPHPEVSSAFSEWRDAERDLEGHRERKPAEPASISAGDASEDELRGWARELEAQPSLGPEDPELAAQLEASERRLDQHRKRFRQLPLAGFLAVAVVCGLAAMLVDGWGLAAFLAIAGLSGVGLLTWRLASDLSQETENLRSAERRLGAHRQERELVEMRRQRLGSQLEERGLPADPAPLRELADALRRAGEEGRQLSAWRERQTELEAKRGEQARRLRAALAGRGCEASEDLVAAFEAYRASCRERAVQAREAARRPGMESRLADRQTAEAAAAQALAECDRAERELEAAVAVCGVAAETAEARVASLREWQQRRTDALEETEKARAARAEQAAKLGGLSIAELEAEVERDRAGLEKRGEAHPGASQELFEHVDELAAEVARRRAAANQAAADASRLAGHRAERSQKLPSVPEAEEELAQAVDALASVRRLERTLTQARTFLEQAQARIHRDIAPRLGRSLGERLPTLTDGRYREARVDPSTLAIQVRGPADRWQQATDLSHGTAELTYLLLRVALAEHLVTTREVCPLLLDDVTVQCDRERTERVLDLLVEVARERQVIFFTQEEEVLRDAEARLSEERDRLHRLEGRLG